MEFKKIVIIILSFGTLALMVYGFKQHQRAESYWKALNQNPFILTGSKW